MIADLSVSARDALDALGTPVEVPARTIETVTEEIWELKSTAGGAILAIGQRLIEAKAMLSHGEWLPWLEERVEFSEATAQRFMKLAREYTNPAALRDLGASKALALLALPPSEREEFAAKKHIVNGEEKTVAEMSSRELKQALREREEALAERDAAEAARAKMEADLTMAKALLEGSRADLTEAENRAKGYEMKLKQAEERAKADLEKAEGDIAVLNEQLEALRSAPRDVAIETVVDQSAIDTAVNAARKEEEEKVRKKLDRAKKDKEKAEEAKAQAERELAAAQKERETVKEQVRALEKKLAVASSSEMTVFKVHFSQAQEHINKMADCIQKLGEEGDAEGAAKLKNALTKLLSATLEVVGNA